MKHTPEPWEVHDAGRVDRVREFGPTICAMHPDETCQPLFEAIGPQESSERMENFNRVVAAVNACRGLPTESLTDGVVLRLVEALKAVSAHDPATCQGITLRDCVESMRETAAAALAELSKEVKNGND